MKKNIIGWGIACLFLMCWNVEARSFTDDLSFNLDWQMNAPIGTDYADKISGWGMSLDAGYEVTPDWTVGLFAAFHTNHRYVGRETFPLSSTETLTTDQQQSAFQVPFGAFGRYYLYDNGYIRPYVAGKVGAMYEQNTTYLNTTGYYERPWGFYVSPEIGMNINPKRYHRYGFHVALYYSYATNQTNLFNYVENGRNNIGFRLGVCF